MTSNNTSKGKLTLKLKLPNSSDPKKLALKSAENKRISNSMVQVSVKGRKNNPQSTNNSSQLSAAELESRKLALSNLGNDSKNEDYDVLSKIKTQTQKEEDDKKESLKVEEEDKTKEIENKDEVEIVEKNESIANNEPSYNVDNLNIRDKIKQSVNIENTKKEERLKQLEEKKKLELET
jgi:hypothetical protein